MKLKKTTKEGKAHYEGDSDGIVLFRFKDKADYKAVVWIHTGEIKKYATISDYKADAEAVALVKEGKAELLKR